jgi:hypothetical protein
MFSFVSYPYLLFHQRLFKAFPLGTPGIRYISSSILLVYDSDDSKKWKVRLIDFAHAGGPYELPSGSKIDEDYYFGLTSLNTLFQEILESKGQDVSTPPGF